MWTIGVEAIVMRPRFCALGRKNRRCVGAKPASKVSRKRMNCETRKNRVEPGRAPAPWTAGEPSSS
jgi:hypothetical protein